MGGLARRAAFIKTLRSAPELQGNILLLGCPFEILPDGPDHKPDPERLPAISQALSQIGYNALALTADESAYLQKGGAPLPEKTVVAGRQPQTRLLQVGKLTVGLVFFPDSPDLTKDVPPGLGDAVAAAATSLRGKAALVIGLSGWGMAGEDAFMAAHPGSLDVLLGSGPNAGQAGRPSDDGKTLWSRSYIKGKTINRLDLLALPGAADFAWKPEKTFKATVTSLDENYPADPDIQRLFP